MDTGARGLRVLKNTWEVRNSGNGSSYPNLDLARFTSTSRCALSPISQTPINDVLLNVFGIIVNNVLLMSNIAPVNGPNYVPRPEILTGLIAMASNGDDSQNERSYLRSTDFTLRMTGGVATGLTFVDGRANNVVIRSITGTDCYRVFVNAAAVPVVFNFADLRGEITMYRGDHFFFVEARQPAADSIPWGIGAHATVMESPDPVGSFAIVLDNNVSQLPVNRAVPFVNGTIQLVNPYTGYVDIRVNICNPAFAPIGETLLYRNNNHSNWVCVLQGLNIPQLLTGMLDALMIRLGIQILDHLDMVIKGDYLRILSMAIYYTAQSISLEM